MRTVPPCLTFAWPSAAAGAAVPSIAYAVAAVAPNALATVINSRRSTSVPLRASVARSNR